MQISPEILKYISRIIVLLTAMPVHECAHGLMANYLGDPTPKEQKRLSLNPFRHLDPLGSLLLIFMGFGWAKPVMVDTRNFRNPQRDMGLTALAGPASNILLALACTILFKIVAGIGDIPALRESSAIPILILLLSYMVQINLMLAVFNLLPIPPLDGSKILGVILPENLYFSIMKYERYVAGLLFILIFFTDILTNAMYWMADKLILFLDFITVPIDLLFYL